MKDYGRKAWKDGVRTKIKGRGREKIHMALSFEQAATVRVKDIIITCNRKVTCAIAAFGDRTQMTACNS